MVLMNIKLKNFLIFDDFELSMSYPKKIVGSTIPEENLADRPNFRYKKLVVMMGANASGKTTLGKVLMACFNFIARKEYKGITSLIEDTGKDAEFELDFAFPSFELYRIHAVFKTPSESSLDYASKDIIVEIKHEPILKKDSYELCIQRLMQNNPLKADNYIMALEQVPPLSWYFEFPFAFDGKQHAVKPIDPEHYGKVLEKTLQVLDPRIRKVAKIPDTNNTYSIIREHSVLIIDEGKVLTPDNLSSGTAEGVGIANIVSAMKLNAFDFYYCDEKFSHIHTDLEKTFLSLFVELLGDNQQLFFTTHNSDILEMNLPKHSFAFLRRSSDSEAHVSCIYASEYLKKNTDSIKNAVENDLFSCAPDLEEIYRIKEL